MVFALEGNQNTLSWHTLKLQLWSLPSEEKRWTHLVISGHWAADYVDQCSLFMGEIYYGTTCCDFFKSVNSILNIVNHMVDLSLLMIK